MFTARDWIEREEQGEEREERPAPGKVTLTSRLRSDPSSAPAPSSEPAAGAGHGYLASPPVQRLATPGAVDDPFMLHTLAGQGVAGAGSELPHREQIQASFGHHDVSGVRAHVGGDAAQATGAIGAQAYATGDDVAFAASPDLRQAAHEAAHVVQQRGGVRLDGGVGRAGDPYEQHADQVADRVVRGESAEALLDTMAHRGSGGGPAVQRLVEATDAAAVARIRRLVEHGRPAEVAAIGTAISSALDAMVGPVARVDVEFAHRGEQYRLRVPVADARALCGEIAQRLERGGASEGAEAPARGRGARDAERPAGRGGERPAGDGLPDVEYEVSHGYERDYTPPAVPTPFGPIQAEATLRVGGTVGPPEREGRGGHPPPGRVTIEGTESTGEGGGREQSLSVEGEGVLRRMIDHDLAGFADHFEISHDHDGLHFSAGMISPEAELGPLTFQFGIDVVHYDPGASGHPPMSLMSPSATCTVELNPRVLAAIGLEAHAHGSVEIEVRWHPNWPAIWRAISARFAPYFATLGGEAAAGATAGELAAAGVTTGAAVPVAVGVGAALAGLVFVGGVMWSMARAAEEGRRQGLATWYIHEYAVQFGDTLFHTFGQHVHDAERVPGAARLAGQGRSDARDAVRRLTPEQRQQLLQAGRVAVVREVADRLARELDVPFDSSRLR